MKTLKEIQEEINKDCGNTCAKRVGFDSCIACMEKEAQQKTFNECITAFRELIKSHYVCFDDQKDNCLNILLSELPDELPEVKE